MPDQDLPLDPSTVPLMRVKTFAEFAIEAALWLVRESMDAIANKTDLSGSGRLLQGARPAARDP